MANVTITQLPAAGPITGTESVPIVQNGQTVQTTTAAIAASPSQFQTFLTLNNEPTLPASRYLSTGTGLGLTDGGAQSDLEIILNGASGSLEAAGNGVIVKTGGTTVTARTISTSGAGLTIANGNGVSGNPTIALDGLAASLANMGGTGILGVVGGASITSMEILGTAGQITVANGTGPSNPTISITTDPILPGTGAVTIPKGTTAQRPGGVDGMIRFNTETSAYETYDTTGGWSTLPSGAVTFVGTGTGLTGGPITSSGTISIADTTVVAGTYGSASEATQIIVNAQGQLTSASTIEIAIDADQITSGVVTVNQGGTGLNSYNVGDIVYYDGTSSFGKLPVVQGSFLVGGSTAPEYQDPLNLLIGTAVKAGNLAQGSPNQIPYQFTTDITLFIDAPTVANTFLEWSGSAFQWSANPLGTVSSVDVSGGTTGLTTSGGPITSSGTITLAGTLITSNGGTGLNSYSAGDLVYYSAGTSLTQLSIGSSSYVLTSTGSAPQWSDPSSLVIGTATNLAGGAAGSIPYQTASGVTAMLATSSGVLVGGTTPSYSTAPSLTGTNFTSIPNAALDNSAVTIGTTSISLGSSSLTLGGLTTVTVTQDPTNALDLATKQYVDGLVVSGIHYHAPVRVESPTPLTATYNNGSSGVGATLTNAGTQVALVIDGVTLSLNDRVLIYTQTNATENGIYYVSDVGSISTNWELTRATDADTYGLASPTTLGEGSTVFVQQGDTGAGELYTCNTVGTITFGTTNITFVQILSAQIYSAGAGLNLSGTQFSVATNGISDAMLRQSAGLSVIGRSTNSTGDVADITAASDYQVLRRSGTSIGFGAIDVSQSGAVTGTLATGNGGTGLSTYTAGDIVYYAAGTSFTALAIGATNRILTSSGTAPQWSDPANITVGSATTAVNVAGGGAGQIVYNTASGTTTFLALGTSTYLLRAGASAPEYVDPSTVTVGTATNATSATTATNVAGGDANRIVFNTASGVTSFITAPTIANTFLEWSGSAFQWSANPLGTVTSIDVSGGTTGLTTSGGPVTSSGTITLAGTLITSNGGTGLSSYTAGDIVYYATGTALTALAIGATNRILTSSGTAPQWSDPANVSVGNATNADNVAVAATSTNATFYPTFVDATSGDQAIEVDTDLTYNPSTNTLTVPTLVATTGISGGTF